MKNIPLATPHMSGHEEKYIQQAFSSNWIAPVGENIQLFEEKIKTFTKANEVVATNSGTSALHLVLKLLNIREGDVVFCPTFTFIATINPILYEKAIPVFIDSELETWNMCPKALENAFKAALLNHKMPKAVIVVHLYGMPAKMKEIIDICSRYNVPVIEDAAESLGSTYKGIHTGAIGQFGIYSFNGNKIITTSSGGALIVNNPSEKKRAIYLASQAKLDAPYYLHEEIGFNYRLSNVSASIGCGQMDVLQQRIDKKRAINKLYKNHLIDFCDFQLEEPYSYSNQWLTAVLLKKLNPAELMKNLSANQIETRRLWNPMHKQPLFKNHQYFKKEDQFSVSDYLFANGICLPSDTKMTEEQQLYTIKKLMEFVNNQQQVTIT